MTQIYKNKRTEGRKDPTSETDIQLIQLMQKKMKKVKTAEDEIVTEKDNSDEIFKSLESEEEVQEPLRRFQRERKLMVRSEYITYYARSEEQESESISAEEILSRLDSQGWRKDIKNEMDSLVKNDI